MRRGSLTILLVALVVTAPTVGWLTTGSEAASSQGQRLCRGVPAAMVGTVGRDRLVGTPGRDVIAALSGYDMVSGRGGNDLICGGEGADHLDGGPGDDELRGRGNGVTRGEPITHDGDWLTGGRGDDLLFGGGEQGKDFADCRTVPAAVTADLGLLRVSGPGIGADRVDGDVEVVIGSTYGDRLRGSARRDELWGAAGDDRIAGLSGRDRLYGDLHVGATRHGNDRLRGGAGRDIIDGSLGRDRLWGGAAGDNITGGLGSDRVGSGRGADYVLADVYCCVPREGGDDVIITGPGDDGVDSYWGDDVVRTGPGNDRVDDYGGRDTMRLGAGRDELTATFKSGADISGGPGRDDALVDAVRRGGLTWDLGSGQVTAPVKARLGGFEIVSATDYADRITGTSADEQFYVFAGNDRVRARGGDDYIATYNGSDFLNGGNGTDRGHAGTDADTCTKVERTGGCEHVR
ncbi:MAG: hypothetical protein H0V49_10030 [Nocardioidaceae bacterium]|nr:hypothetical protein [Nocardioidaceae bacterium]